MRGWALVYIPDSGLFLRKGQFYDGDDRAISFDRITIYSSLAKAEHRREELAPSEAYRQGKITVFSVEILENHESLGSDHPTTSVTPKTTGRD